MMIHNFLLDREFRKKTSPSLLNLKSPMQSPRNSKVTIIILAIIINMIVEWGHVTHLTDWLRVQYWRN